MGHRLAASVPVVLAMLLVASCDSSPTTDTFELSGVVTVLLESGDGGGPIEGARVTFTSDTLLQESATTDSDGRYRMRVESDVSFGQVRAQADGFRPQERTVYFDTPRRRVDLQLRRMPGGGED